MSQNDRVKLLDAVADGNNSRFKDFLDAEVAGGIDWCAGTADIIDNVSDGRRRCLFEGMGIEIGKMAQVQLSAIMAIDTDQAQTANVKIMFTREITVELVRRLQRLRPVTG